MKFSSDAYRCDPGHEGAYVFRFIQRALSGFDPAGEDVLEIGPKHGLHTRLIDVHGPRSITCVDLPSKREHVQPWMDKLTVPHEFTFSDFLRFKTDKKFGLIMFAGVLYHNVEQVRMLKKLRSMAKPECHMIFESSCTRTDEFRNKNVIEVHWPDRFRGVETIIFMPSKSACKSMLEVAGWQCVEDSDSHPDLINTDRITIHCVPGPALQTYLEVDHEHVEDG